MSKLRKQSFSRRGNKHLRPASRRRQHRGREAPRRHVQRLRGRAGEAGGRRLYEDARGRIENDQILRVGRVARGIDLFFLFFLMP